MVFESRVVDWINKHLGDYVENLDRSKLIWGGMLSVSAFITYESADYQFINSIAFNFIYIYINCLMSVNLKCPCYFHVEHTNVRYVLNCKGTMNILQCRVK